MTYEEWRQLVSALTASPNPGILLVGFFLVRELRRGFAQISDLMDALGRVEFALHHLADRMAAAREAVHERRG